MNQAMSQLPLASRIKALKESVIATRAAKENAIKEEAALMDELARAEGEVIGKAPGWEGVQLSGLIPEGENPHIPHPGAPDEQAGAADEEPEPSFLEEAGEADTESPPDDAAAETPSPKRSRR